MRNFILCHGFNEKDAGKETIDKLIPSLYYDNVQQADYGYFGLFGVRWFNASISRVISGMSLKSSVGVGHSNGCAILAEACKYTKNIKNLVLINPALDSDFVFPENIDKIIIYHNKNDEVVTCSKFIPWHVWGEMGRVGYTGSDHRVTNVETNKMFGVSGHSGVFDKSRDLVAHIKSQL